MPNPSVTTNYEEGDWTAGFTCGTSGTITINAKTGHYVKIGKQVTAVGYFTVTSVSSPVGQLTLSGLPFTCGSNNKYYAGVSIIAQGLEVTAVTSIVGAVEVGTTNITIYKYAAGAITALAGDVKGGSMFIISATYFTD